MNHMLQRARRCQLLTGSFDGNDTPCPCDSPTECQLTEKEREHYKQHPVVTETLEKNRAKWQTCRDQQCGAC